MSQIDEIELAQQLCRAGWKDAKQRPDDGQFVAYLFQPFMSFYCGNYDKEIDCVASKGSFTTWLPEVLVWYPLPDVVKSQDALDKKVEAT